MRFKVPFCMVLLMATSLALARDRFTILVDGSPLSAGQLNRVAEVQVSQQLADFDTCELVLRPLPGRTHDAGFEVGTDLEVQVAESSSIFKGEVVGIEPIYVAGRQVSLVVRGYDKSHRLTRGRRSRTWQDVNDSDLVHRLASEHGLGALADDPGLRYAYVFQHNQTDLEFLRERASRIGFQLDADGDVLRFRNVVPGVPSDVELSDLSIDGLVDRDVPGPIRVEVRGWNPVSKTPIVGAAEADLDQVGPGLEYQLDGGDPLSEEPGNDQFLVFSEAEVQRVAAARLQALLRESRTLQGESRGDPRLRPGVQVEVSGVGRRFEGRYFVQQATHQISRGGYKTHFKMGRDE